MDRHRAPFRQYPQTQAYDANEDWMTTPEEIAIEKMGPATGRSLFSTSDDDAEDSVHPSPKRQRTGFRCVNCNMGFTEKRALARHRKTDHHRRQLGLPLDRRHTCSLCGKSFSRGHDAKRHQNEQHPEGAAAFIEQLSGGSEYSEQASSDGGRSTSAASYSTGETSIMATADAPVATLPLPPDDKFVHSASPLKTELDQHSDGSDGSTGTAIPPHKKPTIKKEKITQTFADGSTRSLSTQSPESHTTAGSSEPKDHEDIVPDLIPFMPPFNKLKASSLRKNSFEYQQVRDIDSWQPLNCIMCGLIFEDDPDELVKHVKRHLDNFKGNHSCKECQIDFVHEEDLSRHLENAAGGHCGFSFAHTCSGHHPPIKGEVSGLLSDNDRVRLFNRLRNWEQAQLHAYIAEINDLVASSRGTRKVGRWSDVILRYSRNSMAISVNTHGTAPCDTQNGRLDIGGLQKRLQGMSLGNAGERMRRMLHLGHHDLRKRTIDKSLQKAVNHGDLTKAKQQLEMGADPSIIHEDQGPFTAVGLWGHGYTHDKLAAHRFDEDLFGSCSICKISSARFKKAVNKVESLLLHGASANQPGGLCGYPLSTAAWMGKADIVALLIGHGADVGQMGGQYGTALCAAAAEAGYPGQSDVVQILIGHNADVHAKGPEGTALSLAKKRREHWALLEDYPADIPQHEVDNRIERCDQIIRLLEVAGAAAKQPVGGEAMKSYLLSSYRASGERVY